MKYTYEINFKYNNEKKINDRKSIFLDTNVWIDLVESSDKNIIETKELLIKLFENTKIFCPLSIATFSEFHKQNYESLIHISKLIDRLSLNLTMKDRNVLYKLEIKNFLNTITDNSSSTQLPKNDIFVPYACMLSNNEFINLPCPPDHPKSKTYIKKYHDVLLNHNFSEYLIFHKYLIPQKFNFQEFNFQKAFINRKKVAKGSKEKMYEYVKEDFVEVTMKPIVLEEFIKKPNLIKYFANFPEVKEIKNSELVKAILKKSPAFKNTIEIMTFIGYDTNRPSNENDYYDFEIMILSTSYCDVLFTKERWIYDQLKRNYSSLLTHTKLFNKYEDFNKYLQELL